MAFCNNFRAFENDFVLKPIRNTVANHRRIFSDVLQSIFKFETISKKLDRNNKHITHAL